MPERPGVYSIDLRAGEISEDSALPTADDLLWGENDGAPTLISAARLLDSGGAALPVTAMAPTEPVDPETGARYAVSGNWGVFSPGQLVTKTATGWYVAAMRIGGLVARLDDPGAVMQWDGSAWTERALISAADQAKIDALTDPHVLEDAEIIAGTAEVPGMVTAEQLKLAGETFGAQGAIPADLDDLPDGATRFAMDSGDVAYLVDVASATYAATPETIVKRSANGRIKAAAGADPDDVATVSQIGGVGGTGTTDLLRYRATASSTTALSAATATVVALDTEAYDRNADLALVSNAVLLPAGTFYVEGTALISSTTADLTQPTYALRIAHNASGSYVEQAGLTAPQFPAPDANAGKQALQVFADALIVLVEPASVRLQATSSEAATVAAGASMMITQLGVSVTGGGGGGGVSTGSAGTFALADGANGFTANAAFLIDMSNNVARLPRIARSCAAVSEPTWTDNAATLAAPVGVAESYLSIDNHPAPVESSTDTVLTVTVPIAAPAGYVSGLVEEFRLTVTNAHASRQIKVVTSGFTADGAIAKQLRLYPGDSGTLRYWYALGTWYVEGVPMIDDRLEVDWVVAANAAVYFPARRTMRVAPWVTDQFYLWAPEGAPTATTVFALQERVSSIWTTRFTATFTSGNAFSTWNAATPIVSSSPWRLLAPAVLNGITRVAGGINIGIVSAG